MNCPKCEGPMWDNRPKKEAGDFSPKAPDFKCKDKECGGVIWPDKGNAKAKAAKPDPEPDTPPNEDAERDAWAHEAKIAKWACHAAAGALASALGCQLTDLDQQAVQALASTLIIGRQRR